MKLRCPYCNRTMTAGQELSIGTRVECPACKNPFDVNSDTVVDEKAAKQTEKAAIRLANTPQGVKIVGVDIPLWDMIKLLVEIAVAAIPAFFILWVIGGLLFTLFLFLYHLCVR